MNPTSASRSPFTAEDCYGLQFWFVVGMVDLAIRLDYDWDVFLSVVLSFADHQTLGASACVSRQFRKQAASGDLWMDLLLAYSRIPQPSVHALTGLREAEIVLGQR